MISKAPNPQWDGPHLECETIRDKVTLLVPAEEVPTPRPHGMRITAHAPKQRGWYTDAGGWDVACACGWKATDVVPGGRGVASDVWLQHKATEITALLAPGPRYGRPAAALVRLPNNVSRYVMRLYRLIRLESAGE